LAEPSVPSSCDRNLQSVHRIHISLDAPRHKGRKYPLSLLRLCRLYFGFFLIFAFCCCECLFRYVARFLLYFRPSSSLNCSEFSGVLGIYGCSVEGSWGQSRLSACSSILPVRTNANRCCLATELLISL
jgi:hypothetical protein